MKDTFIESLMSRENYRQLHCINLIASENRVSEDVLTAIGSPCTNKYAEGYPQHRYYPGNEYIDIIEQTAIDRACKLFNCEYANVQPHSGSQANRAVIEAVCEPKDIILSLYLNDGGHLTHGSKVSFSGKYYSIVNYHTDENGYINYKELEEQALIYRPKLIIAGASSYSREWDYKKLRRIADDCHALLLFDMAHTSGLIAAGLMKNPCKWADIVTTTTHKTLRGPRGGLILIPKDFEYKGKLLSKRIDSSVFPGNQGGPFENIIAGKAVCFYEAMQPEFKEYQKQVIKNAKVLAKELEKMGYKILTGGTDNHEFLVDLRSKYPDMTGAQASEYLEKNEIIVNKNMVPGDTRTPNECSGLRIGTPFMTTLGYKESDMIDIAYKINDVLELNA